MRTHTLKAALYAALCLLPLVGVIGCNDDDENTGSACKTADSCYPQAEGPLVGGAAVCLDRVPGGYCTHGCAADTDCCAVKGECRTGFPQVCSPFESTNQKYCFLSCEENLVQPSGLSADDFCGKNAGSAFKCRSSGGGSSNRKVCTP